MSHCQAALGEGAQEDGEPVPGGVRHVLDLGFSVGILSVVGDWRRMRVTMNSLKRIREGLRRLFPQQERSFQILGNETLSIRGQKTQNCSLVGTWRRPRWTRRTRGRGVVGEWQRFARLVLLVELSRSHRFFHEWSEDAVAILCAVRSTPRGDLGESVSSPLVLTTRPFHYLLRSRVVSSPIWTLDSAKDSRGPCLV